MPGALRFEFEADLWQWEARTDSAWWFVALPEDVADELAGLPSGGFGSVPVRVWVGRTEWKTSVFPDGGRGTYVLPVKKAVRVRERIEPGRPTTYAVEVLGGEG